MIPAYHSTTTNNLHSDNRLAAIATGSTCGGQHVKQPHSLSTHCPVQSSDLDIAEVGELL